MKNQESIIKKLEYKNIKPSHIRINIYDYLSRDKIHPTAEEIYSYLSKSHPTLSKTTIYNTLNLFVEKKLIKAININGNKMRYELIRSEHAHLKCNNCSEIYDIPVKIELNLPKSLQNSIIDDVDIIVTGTCASCVNNKN